MLSNVNGGKEDFRLMYSITRRDGSRATLEEHKSA